MHPGAGDISTNILVPDLVRAKYAVYNIDPLDVQVRIDNPRIWSRGVTDFTIDAMPQATS